MIFVNRNGLRFYRFENLSAQVGLDHRIFTRSRGVSRPPFDSLNISHGIGDRRENVNENRRALSRSLGSGELVFARQVHGCEVAVIARKKEGEAGTAAGRQMTADAMVTDIAGKHLVIQVADCQAVLLYEPSQRVVANIHSGWRGSIQNIIGRTVAVMKQDFGCRPELIQAGIGPSLGPCCAEFVNYIREIPRDFWRYGDSRRHFDFWSVSRDQLNKAGVPENHIELSRICTRCHTDQFFSYRSEKTTGRFAVAIGLT